MLLAEPLVLTRLVISWLFSCLVVVSLFFGVCEASVCCWNFFESFSSLRGVIFIWVEFYGEFFICSFKIILCCWFCNSKDIIVISLRKNFTTFLDLFCCVLWFLGFRGRLRFSLCGTACGGRWRTLCITTAHGIQFVKHVLSFRIGV